MRLQELHESSKFLSDDSAIDSWLKSVNIKSYIINSDHTVDVDGPVILYEMHLRDLDKLPVKFRKVTGNFIMEGCAITTLQGCPDEVGAKFEVNNCNRIANIVGCPKIVINDFKCTRASNLQSLHGFNSTVGGNASFSFDAKLQDLLGYAATVKGGLDLDSCHGLISLKGCPREIDYLYLRGCSNLKSLRFGPSKLELFLQLGDCISLKSLEYLPEFVNTDSCLYLSDNHQLLKDLYHVFMAKGLNEFTAITTSYDAVDKVKKIAYHYMKQPYGMKRWIDCQSALIDAGFEEYAEVPE
jgi:hypothetical protein